MAYRFAFLMVPAMALFCSALEPTPQKPPEPARNVAGMANESSFIFRGTVSKLPGTTVDIVPAGASTAVVRVKEMLAGAENGGDFTGHDITVILREPQSVKAGDELVFFADVVAYGTTVAVQEVGHISEKEFTPAGREQVAQAVRQRPERELKTRLARADLVVTGKVVSYKPVTGKEGRAPSSEHEPQWWQAQIAVTSTEKGPSPGATVIAYIPHSDDIRWFQAPKLETGQQGVFLLYKMEIPELKTQAFVAETSEDVQPVGRRERISTLLKELK